jgi:hypothetical protein
MMIGKRHLILRVVEATEIAAPKGPRRNFGSHKDELVCPVTGNA